MSVKTVRAVIKQEVWIMKTIKGIALAIAIIGCINWGLIAIFEFDLVAYLFGTMTMLSRIVYSLVALSGLYLLSFFMKLSDE